MINNRQAGRRNRGRNNGRPNGQNRGGGDNGNRIDNRARGNAAQLLEKYKNMARDAQLAGDRVNVEYYLQFADHYFRVLADNRSRQEEQVRYRRPDDGFDDEGDEFDGPSEVRSDAGEQNRFYGDADGQDDQRNRNQQYRRDRDFQRAPQQAVAEVSEEAPPAPAVQSPAPVQQEEPRGRRPRKVEPVEESGFDATLLPPAISRADNDSDAPAEEEAAPRKRTRRPRPAAEAAE